VAAENRLKELPITLTLSVSLPGLTGQSSTRGRWLDRPVKPGDDREVCLDPNEKSSRRERERSNEFLPIGVSKMIKNFSDHSANERTFLAWVRTAIAVMAFGFIVEKFDLFLEIAAPSLAGRALSIPGQRFGDIAGLALIIIGTAMVAIAAGRFLVTEKHIDSEAVHTGAGSRIDIALAVMLVLVGSALVVYLTHAVVTTR
jgi:putative membrane protein